MNIHSTSSSGSHISKPAGVNSPSEQSLISGAFEAGTSPHIRLEQASLRLEELVAKHPTVAAAQKLYETELLTAEQTYMTATSSGNTDSNAVTVRDQAKKAAQEKFDQAMDKFPEIKAARLEQKVAYELYYQQN